MFRWFYLKWFKGRCRHICFLCKFRKRCEYDRQTLFNKNKPP